MSVQVFQLRCAECGGPLVGTDADAVFFCGPCSLGFEATRSGLLQWETSLRPSPGVEADLWMPFWSIRCALALKGEPSLLRRFTIDARREVFVAGFSVLSVSKIGDPGLFLTAVGAPPAAPPGPLPRIEGCRRGSEAAARYVELFLLELLDRQHDITGLELEVQLLGTQIAALPFLRRSGALECAVTGRRYPSALVAL